MISLFPCSFANLKALLLNQLILKTRLIKKNWLKLNLKIHLKIDSLFLICGFDNRISTISALLLLIANSNGES